MELTKTFKKHTSLTCTSRYGNHLGLPMILGCVVVLGGVANMAPYAISSSLILVIHDNMINETNYIV
jgi:hypothetical protein